MCTLTFCRICHQLQTGEEEEEGGARREENKETGVPVQLPGLSFKWQNILKHALERPHASIVHNHVHM